MHRLRHRLSDSLKSATHLSLLGLTIVLVAVLSSMATSYRAHADDIDQATARQLSASGQILPLEKIHEKAKQIKHGKILETELEKKRGKYLYEVELLDEHGIVWEIKLDAATGQLMKLEED
jgi:uncharacterized membrane protein YkoI